MPSVWGDLVVGPTFCVPRPTSLCSSPRSRNTPAAFPYFYAWRGWPVVLPAAPGGRRRRGARQLGERREACNPPLVTLVARTSFSAFFSSDSPKKSQSPNARLATTTRLLAAPWGCGCGREKRAAGLGGGKQACYPYYIHACQPRNISSTCTRNFIEFKPPRGQRQCGGGVEGGKQACYRECIHARQPEKHFEYEELHCQAAGSRPHGISPLLAVSLRNLWPWRTRRMRQRLEPILPLF